MLIISERCNGMFKNVFEAIEKKDKNALQTIALEQQRLGAHYLDVSPGSEVDDQVEAMKWMVSTIQDAVDIPLSIDSPKVEAIEAGIKLCKRKPIINSTTGEEKKMSILFPLAKEYGASIICLAMDEKGVPAMANERAEVAMKILAKAVEYDIPIEDIFLDPIALPVTVSQLQTKESFETLRLFKTLADPAPKTTIGLSNVSNGAKNRKLINRTYLVMLMASGLDSAILNPADRELMDAMRAANILLNKEIYCDSLLSSNL
ncbi:MAG: dihydropteroate synthase [Thermoplasmata archaeon]